jgi:hypothetical protein
MADAMVTLSINSPGMITSTVGQLSKWHAHTSFNRLALAVCDMKWYTPHSSTTVSDDRHSVRYTCMCSWILVAYTKRSCGSVECIVCCHELFTSGRKLAAAQDQLLLKLWGFAGMHSIKIECLCELFRK